MAYNRRWDARTDQNHSALLKLIRTIPKVSVCDLSGVGAGCPDVLLGYRGQNILIEIKLPDGPPSRSRLNDAQVEWHETWHGQVAVCRTFDDILEVLGIQ